MQNKQYVLSMRVFVLIASLVIFFCYILSAVFLYARLSFESHGVLRNTCEDVGDEVTTKVARKAERRTDRTLRYDL